VAGFGRILLIGATIAAGLGTAIVRAQTVLEDPKNSAKIFAGTCSGCHKSPAGLAKRGGTAAFLREHYTTGPEMSNAMAAYLASAGNGPPPSTKKNEKQKEATAPTATKTNPAQKHDQISTGPGNEPGPDAARPSLRGKQQKNAKGPPNEPATPRMAARPPEPTPLPPERPASAQATPATSASAALNAPGPAAGPQAEPPAAGATLELPPPAYPSEPPADLSQPSAFSSAPLP